MHMTPPLHMGSNMLTLDLMVCDFEPLKITKEKPGKVSLHTMQNLWWRAV